MTGVPSQRNATKGSDPFVTFLAALCAVALALAFCAVAFADEPSDGGEAAASASASSAAAALDGGEKAAASSDSAASASASANASGDAAASASASDGADSASSAAPPADEEEEELTTVERAHRAIPNCIAGLFAGWGVSDPAAFYASDMLLIDDGSCEWFAFDVYRAGATDGSKVFLDRMERYVTESYAGEAHGLDAYSPTTWARAAIVVGTMGAKPQAFGTDADGQPANLLSDGLYNWSYTENLSDQGSNALIYALQAIYALQVDVPADATYSAQYMLDGLLSCQASDGSFALSPDSKTGSVDLTGMALAALAPYRDMPDVSKAVDAALEYLAKQEAADGGFAAEGESTSESCSMVLIGLSACGIDATVDRRFAKKGGSPLDALLAFQKADGTFAHVSGDLGESKVRDLPTEQALRALLAFEELRQGGDGNVYTSDVKLDVWQLRAPDGQPADAGFFDTGWVPYLISIFVGMAAGLVAVMIIWSVRRIRRKARR